jgi:hypothetical protein
MSTLHRRWRARGVAIITALLALSAACGADNDAAPGGGGGFAESPPRDGAASVSSGSEDSGGSPGLISVLDRRIVRVATIELDVENVGARFEDIGNIAAEHSGYVASSTFGRDGDDETASVTIKVPVDRYQPAVTALRRLGDVRQESSNANDVTEEFADYEARLRHLRATEAQYLEFLDDAPDINAVLLLQDRLNAVRLEIEQVQGRINVLEHSSDLATITVHLAPVAATKAGGGGPPNPLEVGERAFEASLEFLRGFAVVIVAIAAFSWWLLPLAVAGAIFGRRAWRDQRRPAP